MPHWAFKVCFHSAPSRELQLYKSFCPNHHWKTVQPRTPRSSRSEISLNWNNATYFSSFGLILEGSQKKICTVHNGCASYEEAQWARSVTTSFHCPSIYRAQSRPLPHYKVFYEFSFTNVWLQNVFDISSWYILFRDKWHSKILARYGLEQIINGPKRTLACN